MCLSAHFTLCFTVCGTLGLFDSLRKLILFSNLISICSSVWPPGLFTVDFILFAYRKPIKNGIPLIPQRSEIETVRYLTPSLRLRYNQPVTKARIVVGVLRVQMC